MDEMKKRDLFRLAARSLSRLPRRSGPKGIAGAQECTKESPIPEPDPEPQSINVIAFTRRGDL